jgi:ubiquinone/menaquinone biosynthesis C-methylase UbiE
MPKIPMTTNWHTNFDNSPTSEAPRIRFSEKFGAPYLEKRTMILEIGCGTGSYTRLIDRSGYIALDIDINIIKIAKKYCINSEFIVASALNLPFKKEIFDLICTWAVFEEIAKGTEKQMVVEIERTLTSNAAFLLSAYNDNIVCKILDPAYVFRGFRHYNLKKFLSLFSECGLFVNEYVVCGGFNTLVANFLVYFYKHVLKRKEGWLKNFFDKKSINELNSNENGIVYIFMAGYKK